MAPLKQVRAYHLILAVLAMAAYLTGDDDNSLHRLIGYAVATALLVRLLLAATGIGSFGWRRLVPPLRAPPALAAMKHPAISRVLILLILATVAGTATTGVMMDGGATLTRFNQSTLETGAENRGSRDQHPEGDGGEDGGEQDDEEEGVLGEIHELFANLILIFVGVHIAYLVIFRLPMAKFMLFWPTNRPRRPGGGAEE